MNETQVWGNGEMILTTDNWNSQKKPAPVPCCPPQVWSCWPECQDVHAHVTISQYLNRTVLSLGL